MKNNWDRNERGKQNFLQNMVLFESGKIQKNKARKTESKVVCNEEYYTFHIC